MLRQLPTLDYSLIRASILKGHGPTDPTGYFRRALFRVKASYREESREQLTRFLTVYNRAADDARLEKLTQKALCYPFIGSFPPATAKSLEQRFSAQPNPFEHLFRLAPTRPTGEPAPLHLAASVSHMPIAEATSRRSPPITQKRKTADSSVSAALLALSEKINRLQSKQRRVIGPCHGCGGTCASRSTDCPAYTRTCFSCGKVGHFSNVCGIKPGANATPNNRPGFRQTPTNSFRFGPKRPGQT
jgi:hypothetical protein